MALKAKNKERDVFGPFANEKWHLFLLDKNSKVPMQIENIGITYPNPEYRVARDDSNLFVFEFVISGKGYLEFEDKIYTLVPGDFYIIEPHTRHADYSDKANPYHKIWINFSSDCFKTVFDAYGLNGINVFKNIDIRPYFDQLLLLSEKSNYSDDIAVDVSNVLFQMLHLLAKQMRNPHGDISPVALKIKNFLDDAAFSEISLDEVVKGVNYSRKQINRIFKKEFGKTPYEYYLNVKLGFAKKYLVMTDLSIKEISEKLHFNNQYYFSSLFKKKVGMPPLRYRASKKGKSEI